jgi:2-dehydro-3-deoxyphosphogluconate aldolase/(4S)-4-hydroxy-2-oxoglutarate aldolase
MDKPAALRILRETGLVPIVRTASADEALSVVEAIQAAGAPVIEITLTVPRAIRLLEQLADRFGDKVLLGAGTVLDAETCRAAILAGAGFIVSPHLDRRVIEMTRRYSKVSVPAGFTPTEIVSAWDAGADFVKVFPCGNVGGASYIRALKGPLPQIEMVPTGGVSLDTAADLIKAGAAALAAGGELVDKTAVREKRWDAITENTRKFLGAIAQARRDLASGR